MRVFLRCSVTVYLLVVAAVIIDSYPLKYFWGVAREYLIPSSARILPPTLPISPYLSVYVFGHIGRF